MTDVPGTLKNIITPGSIDVKLTETKWIPENGKQLTPECEVDKNPAVINTGKNEAWIFLKLQIPVKEIVLVDPASRKKKERSKTELFSFETDERWKLLNMQKQEKYTTCVYGYREIVKPGKTTAELFQKVRLVNYLEGELDEKEELLIPIEAMAIQTNVCALDAGLEEVYQQYLLQKMAGGRED